jgi:hypothetical protein
VLPLPAAGVGAIASLNVIDTVPAADVRVAVEVVIAVDVDITAAPAGAPTPAAAPGSTHSQANAERDRARRYYRARRGVIDRRIGVDRRAVNHRRVVRRNVNHLRVRLLNNNDFLALNNPRLNVLLLVVSQCSRSFGFGPHTLNGIHHVLLLRKKRITEIRGPLNVVSQTFDYVRQRSHRLNARIPWLLLDCFAQLLLVFPQAGVSLQPLLQLNDLQRVG